MKRWMTFWMRVLRNLRDVFSSKKEEKESGSISTLKSFEKVIVCQYILER